MEKNYNTVESAGSVPIKMWTMGVPVETEAHAQPDDSQNHLLSRQTGVDPCADETPVIPRGDQSAQ